MRVFLLPGGSIAVFGYMLEDIICEVCFLVNYLRLSTSVVSFHQVNWAFFNHSIFFVNTRN